MKLLASIVEYNPFHKGHEIHISKSKELSGSDCFLALMSGSFVQRGEPAIIDKWSRAASAIESGADLVLEFPFLYSSQVSEIFARGAVKLFNHLKLDYLSFGIEANHPNALIMISEIIANEPPLLSKKIKQLIKEGNSYSSSYLLAIANFFEERYPSDYIRFQVHEVLKGSNNILALEYLKYMLKSNSKIKPIMIKRVGSEYGETKLNNPITSATALRSSLASKSLENIDPFLPEKSLSKLMDFKSKYAKFNSIDNYENILFYKLRNMNLANYKRFLHINEGMAERFYSNIFKSKNLDEFINITSCKTISKSRIKRFLMHVLNDLTEDLYLTLDSMYPNYIKILASNQKGFELIKELKLRTELPIITKYSSDMLKINNNSILHLEELATENYFLVLDKNSSKMDYYTSPFIKNS